MIFSSWFEVFVTDIVGMNGASVLIWVAHWYFGGKDLTYLVVNEGIVVDYYTKNTGLLMEDEELGCL